LIKKKKEISKRGRIGLEGESEERRGKMRRMWKILIG
jgi:hypothetical protein